MSERLKSRKLWVTIATIALGALGTQADEQVVQAIATLAAAVAPIVYIWVQGKIDEQKG